MSTAPASSHASTAGAGHAAGARAAHAAARKPGAHGTGTDHFSMLLSLLSASDPSGLPAIMGSADGSTALSATDALATDPNAATAADGSHLAAVMQWMGLPQGQAAKRTAVTDADTDTGLAAAGGRSGKDSDAAGILTGQTGNVSTRATGQGDALPAGMQLLDQAESPDSATLAALASTEGVAAETASPDQLVNASLANATSATSARANPGAGRLSAHAPAGAHAQASPAPSTQALQQAPASVQIDRLQSRGDNTATAIASTRSTVTLDERFSATTPTGDALGAGAASSAAATAPASTGAGSSGGDLSGQTGHGGQDTSAAASSSGNDSNQSGDSNPDDGALWAAEERAQNEERLDSFTAPTLHEAKLRVGDDGSDAIDIRLSLSGQELDLGFRTDSAEARAALADHAEGSLGELLQRSGIQLGDVSVGAQNGQGAGRDARHSAGRTTSAGRIERSGSAPADTPLTPLRPRTDGNRPLDTFA
ncbi:flagellar hook-length control protein FliK [Hydrogenophaga sp. RWCD_12]|uniref:flagellar hook-length control protein FliK n=1 Tax=Hydrogenophaga sp. RWCD_12 TaxID=3391190 RepID=UPI0039849E28